MESTNQDRNKGQEDRQIENFPHKQPPPLLRARIDKCLAVIGFSARCSPPDLEELVQRVNEMFIMMNNRHRPGLKSWGGGILLIPLFEFASAAVASSP